MYIKFDTLILLEIEDIIRFVVVKIRKGKGRRLIIKDFLLRKLKGERGLMSNKKILSVVLSVVMAVSLLAGGVIAPKSKNVSAASYS